MGRKKHNLLMVAEGALAVCQAFGCRRNLTSA